MAPLARLPTPRARLARLRGPKMVAGSLAFLDFEKSKAFQRGVRGKRPPGGGLGAGPQTEILVAQKWISTTCAFCSLMVAARIRRATEHLALAAHALLVDHDQFFVPICASHVEEGAVRAAVVAATAQIQLAFVNHFLGRPIGRNSPCACCAM